MAGYKNKKRSRRDEDEESEVEVAKPSRASKKTKTAAAAADSGKDDDGNPFWALAPKRRVGLSEFKGVKLINIREYYSDASGDLKPTKKGISLSVDQYNAFLKAIPSINAELAAAGVEVADIPTGNSGDVSPSKSKKQSKESKKPKKANIEATSDEESGEGEEDEDDED